jgi:glutamate dehydrogenase
MDLFNKSLVKTNFFNPNKSATSFRLDPSVFLKDMKLPEVPYGMYLILGRDFTGFHIRFRDISRGGVRIILSNSENFVQNRYFKLISDKFNLMKHMV